MPKGKVEFSYLPGSNGDLQCAIYETSIHFENGKLMGLVVADFFEKRFEKLLRTSTLNLGHKGFLWAAITNERKQSEDQLLESH